MSERMRRAIYNLESNRRLVEAQRQIGFISRRMDLEEPKEQRASELLSFARKEKLLGSRRPALLAAAAIGAVEGVSERDPNNPRLKNISRHAGNLDMKELAARTFELSLLYARPILERLRRYNLD